MLYTSSHMGTVDLLGKVPFSPSTKISDSKLGANGNLRCYISKLMFLLDVKLIVSRTWEKQF